MKRVRDESGKFASWPQKDFLFKDEQELPEIAIKIIKQKAWGNRNFQRTYIALYTCCNKEVVVNEKLLMERFKRGNKTCRQCSDGGAATKKKTMRSKFKYHKQQKLQKALILICEQHTLGRTQYARKYVVSHLCCGEEELMTEREISLRDRCQRYSCKLCAPSSASKPRIRYRKLEELRDNILPENRVPSPPILDTWAPPPSVVKATK